MNNPYIPSPARIESVFIETDDGNIKTFTMSFIREKDARKFTYRPGQFAELTVFGKGEAPFGMASSPTKKDSIEFTVSKAGVVTTALHRMSKGDIVGIRGPLGNGYPIEVIRKKNVLIIAGGFGFSTLRALTNYIIEEKIRDEFADITVIYGARRPGLLLYKKDLEMWRERNDLKLCVTVDEADSGWEGMVGTVPAVLKKANPSAENTCVLMCGPPAMIRHTLPVLKELGFADEKIFISLEMRMKCGVGKCGRCNVGSKYVCCDGPVFSYEEIKNLRVNDIF